MAQFLHERQFISQKGEVVGFQIFHLKGFSSLLVLPTGSL